MCGIIAAITYGMNPLGALPLYAEGINVDSVLFYRYGLAMAILAGIMLLQKEPFKIGLRKLLICVFLGVIFATSSFTLFTSFHYMDAGVACTILFIYPIMVAIIMAVFFEEKITAIVSLSIVMALVGIGLLYYGGNKMVLSTIGVLLVVMSALTYAVYIVTVNKSDLYLPPVKLAFFVMLFGVATIVIHSLFRAEDHLQMLTTMSQWKWVVMLAIMPTVISLVLMVIAVKHIGSTPTAIMGALEPVTAVVVGVMVFSEDFSLRVAVGILLIMVAISMIIVEKPISRRLLKKIPPNTPQLTINATRQ